MFSIETVILYLTMVTVTINGQNTVLPIRTTLNVTCEPEDTKNPPTNAVDIDSMTAPTTCAATTNASYTSISIDLMRFYSINTITIANKPTIILSSGQITTTANSGLNQPSGTPGMTVFYYTNEVSLCNPVYPGTSSAPFGTITATAVTATYNCNNMTIRFIYVNGPSYLNAAVCAFTIMLMDQTTTTEAVIANKIATRDSRSLIFDWSILIAMLLAAMMNYGRNY